MNINVFVRYYFLVTKTRFVCYCFIFDKKYQHHVDERSARFLFGYTFHLNRRQYDSYWFLWTIENDENPTCERTIHAIQIRSLGENIGSENSSKFELFFGLSYFPSQTSNIRPSSNYFLDLVFFRVWHREIHLSANYFLDLCTPSFFRRETLKIRPSSNYFLDLVFF